MAEVPTPQAHAQVVPSIQLLAEVAQNQEKLPEHVDTQEVDMEDRSSSLSDIEDRTAVEEANAQDVESSQVSEGEETEAETEQYDNSPEKRLHRMQLSAANSLLTGISAASMAARTQSVEEDDVLGTEEEDNGRLDQRDDVMDQISDISSLSESPEPDMSRSASPSSSPLKRKRSSISYPDDDAEDETERLAKKVTTSRTSSGSDRHNVAHAANQVEVTTEQEEQSPGDDEESGAEEDIDVTATEVAREEPVDIANSPPDDGDMDDAGAAADVDASARTEEEVSKKRAALDMLSGIERDFASLRDKLFSEKARQLNEELALLNSPDITHPEYLAVLDAIDRRRDEAIRQAKIRLEYQLKTLQVKSISERAQAHSQYMQNVRELRDTTLEAAGKEWYEIRRERNKADEEEQEKLYHFSNKRSALIKTQTAYNTEVSLLSGIQKYVGFPAAPEITGVTESEIEEDLRKMGLTQASHQIPATSLQVPHFARQRTQPDERVSEVASWAMPQPQHRHQMLNPPNRHSYVGARAPSPFVTPIAQRRISEANGAHGSASTIAASSLIPTPVSTEDSNGNLYRTISGLNAEGIGETPSRPPGYHPMTHLTPATHEQGLPTNDATYSTPANPNGKAQIPSDTTMAVGMSSSPTISPPKIDGTYHQSMVEQLQNRFSQVPGVHA